MCGDNPIKKPLEWDSGQIIVDKKGAPTTMDINGTGTNQSEEIGQGTNHCKDILDYRKMEEAVYTL